MKTVHPLSSAGAAAYRRLLLWTETLNAGRLRSEEASERRTVWMDCCARNYEIIFTLMIKREGDGSDFTADVSL